MVMESYDLILASWEILSVGGDHVPSENSNCAVGYYEQVTDFRL